MTESKIGSAIGARLRAARDQRGLTLKALADTMGVTPSLLSQIETDKVLPSLNTLYRLAAELDISIDALLDLAPGDGRRTPSDVPLPMSAAGPAVQRREENPALEMTSGVRWERLAGGAGELVKPLLITYAPHAHSSFDGSPMRQRGYEFGLVLTGTLSLTLGSETYLLRAGDSVHFDTSRPHVYVNDSDTEASGVWFVLRGGLADLAAGGQPVGGRSLTDVLTALAPQESW